MAKFRIKELLKLRGLTFNALADSIGADRANLSNSLAHNPRLGRLEEIAKILAVDVTELFVQPPKSNITGFIEYENEVFKINSIGDLESLLTKIKKP